MQEAKMKEGMRYRTYEVKRRNKKNRNYLEKIPARDSDLMEAMYYCFLLARAGKTATDDEHTFEIFWYENLEQLEHDIIYRVYKPGRSKAFITHNPVTREIFAAPFRDRIVHHLLYGIVAPWWDKHFIYDSYSCRYGKGTDFGIQRLQKAMRRASQNGTRSAYVLKGDLSGYFMSLKRDILYEKVMWGLERQFPGHGYAYELCAYLWKEIIYDDPIKGVRLAGKKSDWDSLPANKSLFNQPPGQGIVIGNLTSQLLSNIMLNEFDWWMKTKMGFKYYGRYVDDFYMVVPENEYGYALAAMAEAIPEYLSEMGLTLHPKKLYAQEVRKGCPFLGKMVHLNCLLPGKRFKKNTEAALLKFVETGEGYDTVASYLGMSKNMNAKKYMNGLIEKYGGRV
ncbi:reverse transcriptase [Candidatus Saccharibacteria bacterium]|nr:reverse transcriptase [Candidatus Saccharibacteria bacterium]